MAGVEPSEENGDEAKKETRKKLRNGMAAKDESGPSDDATKEEDGGDGNISVERVNDAKIDRESGKSAHGGGMCRYFPEEIDDEHDEQRDESAGKCEDDVDGNHNVVKSD